MVGHRHSGTQPLLMPRGGPRDRITVFLHHPANTVGSIWSSNYQDLGLACALASAGFPCYAPDLGGTLWGNDTAMLDFDDALDFVEAQGCRVDLIAHLGISHGLTSAMNATRRYPDIVGCIVGIAGFAALEAARLAHGTVADTINTAWGMPAGSDNTTNPLPDRADPANPLNLAITATSPARVNGNGHLYYSGGDTESTPTANLTMASALGFDATQVSATRSHTDGIADLVPAGDVIAMLHQAERQ